MITICSSQQCVPPTAVLRFVEKQSAKKHEAMSGSDNSKPLSSPMRESQVFMSLLLVGIL
jgi:hypothetical protein